MIWADVAVNFRNRYVRRRGVGFAEDFVLSLAELAEREAKRNVAPGMGPGPHPHRTPHEDTGRLRESITADVDVRGDEAVAVVSTDVEYGVYLEVGAHMGGGEGFYRYPWLWPAVNYARRQLRKVAFEKAKVWFEGEEGVPVRVPWKFYRIVRE